VSPLGSGSPAPGRCPRPSAPPPRGPAERSQLRLRRRPGRSPRRRPRRRPWLSRGACGPRWSRAASAGAMAKRPNGLPPIRAASAVSWAIWPASGTARRSVGRTPRLRLGTRLVMPFAYPPGSPAVKRMGTSMSVVGPGSRARTDRPVGGDRAHRWVRGRREQRFTAPGRRVHGRLWTALHRRLAAPGRTVDGRRTDRGGTGGVRAVARPRTGHRGMAGGDHRVSAHRRMLLALFRLAACPAGSQPAGRSWLAENGAPRGSAGTVRLTRPADPGSVPLRSPGSKLR
jgi:hypothetical protein